MKPDRSFSVWLELADIPGYPGTGDRGYAGHYATEEEAVAAQRQLMRQWGKRVIRCEVIYPPVPPDKE